MLEPESHLPPPDEDILAKPYTKCEVLAAGYDEVYAVTSQAFMVRFAKHLSGVRYARTVKECFDAVKKGRNSDAPGYWRPPHRGGSIVLCRND